MAYTYTSRTYGPRSWQRMLFGTNGSGGTLPAILFVPGGGWGLRDPSVITEPTLPGAEPFMAGALANAASAYFETYRVFVLQVASTSHNAYKIRGHNVWIVTTNYVPGNFVLTNAKYQCKRTHTATKATAPCADWASGTNYIVGSLVRRPTDGRTYESLQIHTASGANEPGTGGGAAFWTDQSGVDDLNWERDWRLVLTNEVGDPRIAQRGDGTPAYGAAAVTDVQRAIAFIRTHAEDFGVNPARIALAGSSAGGQAVGCAAYANVLPSAINDHFAASRPDISQSLSYPNALLMSITAAKMDQFVTSNVAGVQGGFLSFMVSLYGREGLGDFAGWDALPDRVKRSIDPYRTAERTGWVCPTYLAYPATMFDDRTPTQVYNGDSGLGIGPEIHHAYHGWTYFEKLSKTVANSGWGMPGKTVFLQRNSGSDLRRYTTYNASGGTAGVEYTVIGNSTQTVGEDIIAFFNSVM